MSFGKNLIFLRQLHNKMTQENLAERLNVSRQTISKWEIDEGYPEVSKLIDLCDIFQVSMDDLIKTEMNLDNEAYSEVRVVEVPSFSFINYGVISQEPEDDAINHVLTIAKNLNINQPNIIGWDFPFLSQEQINVYHFHGYEAAIVLPDSFDIKKCSYHICKQRTQKYASITIKNPFRAAFTLIPNAYKLIMSHIKFDKLSKKEPEGVIPCFEKTYEKDNTTYMDIFIAITE